MAKHLLHTVYTAQYRYAGIDRTDITVKGFDAYGKYFAPSWNMVFGVKNGTMTNEQYVDAYLKILNSVPTRIWDWLFSRPTRTIVCFCAEEAFCHRNILVNYLLQHYQGEVKYGGFQPRITP